MRLAKPHIDVGLFTTELPEHLAFWQMRVGLTIDHVLNVGGGVRQHRFHANGSIIKINHCRHDLPSSPPSRISAVHIATPDILGPTLLRDVDLNRVVLVPSGFNGIVGLAVELEVSSIDEAATFWGDILGFSAFERDSFRIGDSLVMLRQVERTVQERGPLKAVGWRYLTIQVLDCRHEHHLALSRGATEVDPPRDLGGVAVVSFIRDPDGNYIELSERASLKRAANTQV